MNTTDSRVLGWAIRMRRDASAVAAMLALRLETGIEVGEDGDALWLRADEPASDMLEARLKTLPAVARYARLPDGRLREHGSRLATAVLPELAWSSPRTWAELVLPPANPPAGLPLRSTLRLVSANETATANAMLLTFDEWIEWVMSAPQFRLTPLVYATRADGMTLVRGLPLPSAPGRHLVEREGVILPAGFACAPDLSMAVVRRALGATEQELVYWDADGARLLNHDLFAPAGRASVRATRDELVNTEDYDVR